MIFPRLFSILVFSLLFTFLMSCATSDDADTLARTDSTTGGGERDLAVAAITRAEAFESGTYAPELLNQAYSELQQGDSEQNADLWLTSKGTADEAYQISAPQAAAAWLDKVDEYMQRFTSLRGEQYMPRYYNSFSAAQENLISAVDAQDWDATVAQYEAIAEPLADTVLLLDANLTWLNQLNQEVEAIMEEGRRKQAVDYVPEIVAETEQHYDATLAAFQDNDLAEVERHLFLSRHFGRETLRILEIVLNVDAVDQLIEQQGNELTQALEYSPIKENFSDENLKAWTANGYLDANPLVDLPLFPREYPGDESKLQQPQFSPESVSALSFIPENRSSDLLASATLTIESNYQSQENFVAQEFDTQQAPNSSSDDATAASEESAAGEILLQQATQAWERAVAARNEGDLERAQYYLGESSRFLDDYNSRYNVLAVYTVVEGDSLWRISYRDSIYGDPFKWPYIYLRNRDLIANPNLIYPEQKFIVPVINYDIPNIKEIIKKASEEYENSLKERELAN